MAGGLDWFNEAKPGLFIHWVPYSQTGVEAAWPIMFPGLSKTLSGKTIPEENYEALAETFDPVDFNAIGWVRAARAAGMRYVVFTAKHHHGLCMFDAPGTDYKITNTPFGRDVVAELSAACSKEGMRFGL
jgi:alpha-L-fucosidase